MVSHYTQSENSPPASGEATTGTRNKRNRKATECQAFAGSTMRHRVKRSMVHVLTHHTENEQHQKEIRLLEKKIARMKKVYNKGSRAPSPSDDSGFPPEDEEEDDEHIHLSSSMKALPAYMGGQHNKETDGEQELHRVDLRRGPLRARNCIKDEDFEDKQGDPSPMPTNDKSVGSRPSTIRKRGSISTEEENHDSPASTTTKRPRVDVTSKNTDKFKKKSPSLDDFDDEVRAIVKQATHEFEVLCVTRDGFPNMNTQVIWAHQCWNNAKRFLQVEDTGSDIPSRASLLICGRTSRIRGHLVDTVVCSLVEQSYGFKSGSSVRNNKKNQELVDYLTFDGRFLYKDLEHRSGFLKHPIITKIIKIAFFKTEHTRGVEFKEYFNPISVATLALIATMIYACILEWESGKQVVGHFKEDRYIKRYEGFYNDIEKWKVLFPEVTGNMLKKMFEQPHNNVCPSKEAGATSIFSEQSIQCLCEEMEGHTGNTDSETDD